MDCKRLDLLLKYRLCMKCGFYYNNPKNHQCRWFGNNKLSVKCQVDACPEGAVVCKKMHKMNMSSELKNWLRKVKINPKDISNSLVVGTSSIGEQNMKFKHNITAHKKIKHLVHISLYILNHFDCLSMALD